MFLSAVYTDAYCWRAVCMGIARWGTERATCNGSTVFCWMSKSPAFLALMLGRNIRFNLIEGSSYIYPLWKILSFEYNSCNIYWKFTTATRINGKTGHVSDIMFVCNQFRKVRRTIRSTDTIWADVIGNENSTSRSVELSIRGQREWFSIKFF